MTDAPRLHVIAHRGGAALRIENTLAAFEHAMDMGADGAELDVHLTHDGQVVVHHDDALHPGYCRDAEGAWIDAGQRPHIAALTFAQLQRFEIGAPRPGSDYAKHHARVEPVAGQHVPLLRDVIRLVKARSPRFRLVVEIKSPMSDAARQPWRRLLAATLDAIRREVFIERATLCSFDWGALLHAKQLCPALPLWFTTAPLDWFEAGTPPLERERPDAAGLETLRTLYATGNAPWFDGFDPRRFPGGYPEAIAAAGGDAWFMHDRDATDARVHAAAARGLRVATWGDATRNRDDVDLLLRTGVGAICLDDPAIALDTLTAR